MESQVAWPGALFRFPETAGLPTLAAFLDIATEVHQPSPAVPLSLVVANITKWRPEILRWFSKLVVTASWPKRPTSILNKRGKPKLVWLAPACTPSGREPPKVGCGFLAVELPRAKWRLVVISVYLKSGTGLHVEPNASLVAELMALTKRLPNWVAAGDWNVDLDKFAGTNIATTMGAEILGDKEAAISTGNTLDFVLASPSVAPLLRLQINKAIPFAPHYSLHLKVDLAQGLLHLPTLPAFPGPSGPYVIPDDSASPGQHSRDAPETGAAPNGLLCSEPTAPWSARHRGSSDVKHRRHS